MTIFIQDIKDDILPKEFQVSHGSDESSENRKQARNPFLFIQWGAEDRKRGNPDNSGP
jgi:hypothetical protein